MVTEKTKDQRMVEKWEEKVKAAGHQFAQFRTVKAIYDRVAIIANLSSMITIQYPQGRHRGKNLKSIYTPSTDYTIVQENIAKRDIVGRIRYYKS